MCSSDLVFLFWPGKPQPEPKLTPPTQFVWGLEETLAWKNIVSMIRMAVSIGAGA